MVETPTLAQIQSETCLKTKLVFKLWNFLRGRSTPLGTIGAETVRVICASPYVSGPLYFLFFIFYLLGY